MIQNLSIYSQWKKSTLDRLSSKYRIEVMNVFKRHLHKIAHQMRERLENGIDTIFVSDDGLDEELLKVFEKHQHETVHVAVSDGFREVTPDRKLSTWMNWHWAVPVEHTFTNLAERKVRDSIFDRINRKIYVVSRKQIAEIIDLEKQHYISNIKEVFKNAARSYFSDPDSTDTEDVVKDAIKRALQVTEPSAERIFRTETTRFFNTARETYFKTETDVDFVQLIAITDNRISNICESRDMYVVPMKYAGLKKFKPPFHWNCRTIQSPLISSLSSDMSEIKRNLGSEFGNVYASSAKEDIAGVRAPPKVPLPRGW